MPTTSWERDHALLEAAEANDGVAVLKLIREGASLHAVGHDRNTALHFAAGSKTENCIAALLLLRNGAAVNSLNSCEETPLMFACKTGKEELVRVLLQAGVQQSSPDHRGFTPMFHAVLGGDCAIVELLSGNWRSLVNQRESSNNMTPLILAAGHGKEAVVGALIECGASLADQDSFGDTALHKATRSSATSDECARVVELLLEHGAPLNVKNGIDETPLLLATKDGNADLVRALLDKGADMQCTDRKGRTALDVAVALKNQSIVLILLEHEDNWLCPYRAEAE